MYVNADTIEQLHQHVDDAALLQIIDQKIDALFPNSNRRLFNNGSTFTAIVYGENPIPTKGYEGAGILNLTPLKNGVSLHCYKFVDGKNIFNKYAVGSDLPKSAIGSGCLKVKSRAFFEKYESTIQEILTHIIDEIQKG